MPRGQRQIVRHMQIFEHLLRNAFEYRSSNLAALVRSHCRIENHRDHNLRIVHRRESGKRSDVFGLRICPRGRIHFLPRSRFSRRRISFENRPAPGTVSIEHDLFHHGAHLRSGVRRNHAVRVRGMKRNRLQRILGIGIRRHPAGNNAWRDPHAVIGKRRN